MRVGVIDIGSNTTRLLVADVVPTGEIVAVAEKRNYLALGREIAKRGELSAATIGRVATMSAAYAAATHGLGVDRLETIVTAPGRQAAPATELVAALTIATAAPVRVLTADEEGRLAFDGAVACAVTSLPDVVGVVDVGGGSMEIAVGTPFLGPAWVRSIDLGSLRLTERCLRSDPPTAAQIAAARDAVRRTLDVINPPSPDVALASGGSARAVARVVGRTFDHGDLEEVIRAFAKRPAVKAASLFGISRQRAGTVLAGALLLGEASRVVGRPFELARGGLREGAVIALAAEDVLAA